MMCLHLIAWLSKEAVDNQLTAKLSGLKICNDALLRAGILLRGCIAQQASLSRCINLNNSPFQKGTAANLTFSMTAWAK